MHTPTTQVRANAKLDLAVCRAHGAAYAYHHYRLVQPFLSARPDSRRRRTT